MVGLDITSLEVAVPFYSVADSMAAVRMSEVGRTLIPLLLCPKILYDNRPSKKTLCLSYCYILSTFKHHCCGKSVLSCFPFYIISRQSITPRHMKLYTVIKCKCRSQWPRGLRRRSAAAHLLRSWFESHRGHGYLSVVSVVCCQVEVCAMN